MDDAIGAIASTLDELALWNSTYAFVTSDHGYNLGQHNLPSCKLNVYDHAVRVPMLMCVTRTHRRRAKNGPRAGSVLLVTSLLRERLNIFAYLAPGASI